MEQLISDVSIYHKLPQEYRNIFIDLKRTIYQEYDGLIEMFDKLTENSIKMAYKTIENKIRNGNDDFYETEPECLIRYILDSLEYKSTEQIIDDKIKEDVKKETIDEFEKQKMELMNKMKKDIKTINETCAKYDNDNSRRIIEQIYRNKIKTANYRCNLCNTQFPCYNIDKHQFTKTHIKKCQKYINQ